MLDTLVWSHGKNSIVTNGTSIDDVDYKDKKSNEENCGDSMRQ